MSDCQESRIHFPRVAGTTTGAQGSPLPRCYRPLFSKSSLLKALAALHSTGASGMLAQQSVTPQQTIPGVLPAGMEASSTQQQVLPLNSIQPSSQQLADSQATQRQHSFPS